MRAFLYLPRPIQHLVATVAFDTPAWRETSSIVAIMLALINRLSIAVPGIRRRIPNVGVPVSD